jgi:hypothetical protein
MTTRRKADSAPPRGYNRALGATPSPGDRRWRQARGKYAIPGCSVRLPGGGIGTHRLGDSGRLSEGVKER